MSIYSIHNSNPLLLFLLHSKASRRTNQLPNHLSWLLSTLRSSGSTPSSIGMFKLLTISEGGSFWPPVSMISFCRPLPKAHDHKRGLERRSKGKSRLHLHQRRVRATDAPVDLMLHPTLAREQDPNSLSLSGRVPWLQTATVHTGGHRLKRPAKCREALWGMQHRLRTCLISCRECGHTYG